MPREISLMRKYAPRNVTEIVGQSFVRFHLAEFLACPYSTAFLFSGGTGIGKTSAARVIASELGAHPTSGVWELSGTDQSDDALNQLTKELRFEPFADGWRVVIVDECDWLIRCPKLLLKWNPILDSYPTRTIFAFTTNHPESFKGEDGARFLRRFQHLPFTSLASDVLAETQELVARIWRGEGMSGPIPRVDAMDGILRDGKLSIGEAVQRLEFLMREARERVQPREAFTLKSRSDAPRTLFQAAATRPRFEYDKSTGKLSKASSN